MQANNNHGKLRALGRLCAFTLLFCALFLAAESFFFSDSQVHPTWAYVSDPEHEPIDILFVGNSHTYTTIDAELLSRSTGLNIRALTCASINGEIVAANIEAFLNYEVPKVIVLEMCPFTAQNFDAMRTSKLGIVLQHFDGIPDILPRFKAMSKVTSLENIPSGVFQLLRNTMMWDRWKSESGTTTGYDAYGSNRKYQVHFDPLFNPKALAASYSAPVAKEEFGMHPRNQNSFINILNLASKHGIDVWIYNAPIGAYDKSYASGLAYIETLRNSYPCIKYIDNSMLQLENIGITQTDFYDAGHLNPNGMEKTSLWMADLIAERFEKNVETDSLLIYQNTSVKMLENGKYRYEFITFADGQYRFVYTINGKYVDTGFSEKNYIEEDAIPSTEINKFFLHLRPNTSDADEYTPIIYHFLPYTIEEYTASIKDKHTLEIKNNSNFSDKLTFAWYVTNTDNNTVEKYPYITTNTLSHTFTESGTYSIRAYTRQMSDDVRRATEIMTVTYDADANKLSVDWAADCITVK